MHLPCWHKDNTNEKKAGQSGEHKLFNLMPEGSGSVQLEIIYTVAATNLSYHAPVWLDYTYCMHTNKMKWCDEFIFHFESTKFFIKIPPDNRQNLALHVLVDVKILTPS